MVIDNFNIIEDSLLNFKPGSYYKFEAIIRQKDGENILATNPNSTSLKFWLIDNQEAYNKLKPIMKNFCDITGARLYFTLDRKSVKKTFVNVSQTLTETIGEIVFGSEFSIHKLNKIVNSETSKKENTDKEDNIKTWLIDIDLKDSELAGAVASFCNTSFISTLESPNGYHVIAKKNFGANKFVDLLETFLLIYFKQEKRVKDAIPLISLHENGLGLVYKGEKR